MNLVEVYVYEVTRRLPEKSRDDIAMELRSTIEDMLPENYSEEDVKKVLSNLGNPAELAASYRDTPNYFIGPKVYDAYISVMKLVIPWAVLVAVLVHVVESIILFNGDETVLSVIIKSFGPIIGNIVSVLIHTFFWITIVFVVIERVGLSKTDLPLTKNGLKWTPDDLYSVTMIPRKKAISKGEAVFSVVWTAIWVVVYFNADHLAGIYRSADGEGLQFVMPVFNQDVLMFYWPVVFMIVLLELCLATYKWRAGQWTLNLSITNAVMHVISIIVLIVIMSNPNLINESIIPYMADVIETSTASVANFVNWLKWTIVVIVLVTLMIEIYDSYRKAKL